MRINKKLIIFTSIAFLTLAATAYASSATFLTQAQKYINQNCSKKTLPNQTALLCYLFNKSQEQDAGIAAINSTLSPIPTQLASLQASTSALNNTVSNLQAGFEKNLSQTSFYTVISPNFNLDPNSEETTNWGCNQNDVAIAGGARYLGGIGTNIVNFQTLSSYPLPDPNSEPGVNENNWQVTVQNTSNSSLTFDFVLRCLKIN